MFPKECNPHVRVKWPWVSRVSFTINVLQIFWWYRTVFSTVKISVITTWIYLDCVTRRVVTSKQFRIWQHDFSGNRGAVMTDFDCIRVELPEKTSVISKRMTTSTNRDNSELKNGLQRRRDLDSLRGWAVLCVLLFHLKINLFRNGHLGVDIFLVLSGYFIYSSHRSKIPLSKFFLNRLSRIFPGYFLFLLILYAIASIVFIPSDLRYFNQGRKMFSIQQAVDNSFYPSESDGRLLSLLGIS